ARPSSAGRPTVCRRSETSMPGHSLPGGAICVSSIALTDPAACRLSYRSRKTMLTPVPPTECSRAREAASARLDGELSELELAQLENHLGECAACAEYAQLITVTALELRAAALEQPSEPIAIPSLRRRVRLVPAAAAAAVVAGIAASSFALGGALGSHSQAHRLSLPVNAAA